jgi:hypothetical protein
MTLLPRDLTVPWNAKGLVITTYSLEKCKCSKILQIVSLIILTASGMGIA